MSLGTSPLGTIPLGTNPPVVSGGITVNATTDTLLITEYSASIKADASVSATTVSLVLTEQAAGVNAAANVAATTDTLVLTEYGAGVNAEANINAGTATLALTTYSASISAGTNTNVNATTVALVITENLVSIKADVGIVAGTDTLTLTTYAGVITSGTPITTYNVIVERQMIAESDDSLFPIDVAVDSTGGVTGLGVTAALRDPNNSSSYLDWSDFTFKTSGWATQYQALTEYGSGFYGTNLDISSITNFPTANHAAVEYAVTGSVVAISQGLLSLSQTWLQAKALTVGKFLGLK